ncbi:MAG TPA: 4-alpha-glucanotransferase, partial [Acidiferrobacteraceae bacterium]|nr:4-alpha-glucanotransferase [Acidiferrobacteraceae bacterium]
GASLIGLNPLHALFLHNPEQASPYSPSSRLFLSPLYLDVEAIPEFGQNGVAQEQVAQPAFQERLAGLRRVPLVDYGGVWTVKRLILEELYRGFLARPDAARARDFQHYQEQRGAALRNYALHEALQEHFHTQDPSIWGWPLWPEDFQTPNSPGARTFAKTHAPRVGFFMYLQWQAEEQLERAGQRARTRLGIGLYRDLAVGVDRAGAETWSDQALYLEGVSVGCPPDDFNRQGQDWGLPPPRASTLRAQHYLPFIQTLDANMRAAGALRIDHVMGLFRLFLIPDHAAAADGTYIHYPVEDLFRLLAQSSFARKCLIVGEDLGTVPPEISRIMAQFRVLSYRLLYFEQDSAGFRVPEHYPSEALVAATTHDLPTLAGFWQETDLAERHALGLFPSPELEARLRHERARDRSRLWSALQARGSVPGNAPPPAKADARLMLGVYTYLAQTPAKLLLVQLEDLLLAEQAVNLPGTVSERPNWRRKLECPLEQLPQALCAQLADHMRAAGRGARPLAGD